MSVVDQFPEWWLCTVTVLRSQGTDDRGYALPDDEIPLDGCLVGSRSTADPVDRTDLTESKGVLMRRLGFVFRSTDRVRVPEGTWLAAGVWSVDGEPSMWPMGAEVPLRKGGG